VVEADLQTSGLSIQPTYNRTVITGYQVTNTVTAQLHNLAGAGALIDGASADRNLGRLCSLTDQSAQQPRGRRTDVRLTHPLYSEVVRAGLGDYLRRFVCRRLADWMAATGQRRAGDRLRLAQWRVAAGTASDAGRLAAAAREANGLHDARTAEVLARASLQLEPSATGRLQLGSALVDQGRFQEADEVLNQVVTEACAWPRNP
jgi:hypothetical protein